MSIIPILLWATWQQDLATGVAVIVFFFVYKHISPPIDKWAVKHKLYWMLTSQSKEHIAKIEQEIAKDSQKHRKPLIIRNA